MRARPTPKLAVTSVSRMRRLSTLFKSGFIQNLQWILGTCEPVFGVLGDHSKSRLQLNHVPVHRTHSDKVTKMLTTCLGAGLARIGAGVV